MTIRSTIAMFYVIAAAAVSIINGPGAGALAGEIAVLAVFETPAPDDALVLDNQTRVHWELDDLPAYMTEETDQMLTDLAPGLSTTEVAEAPLVQ
ncbi:MAG: hypothetical protein AB8B85_18040 [Paracoccaceae bacterium]